MRRVPTIEASGPVRFYEYVGRGLRVSRPQRRWDHQPMVDIAPCALAKFSVGLVWLRRWRRVAGSDVPAGLWATAARLSYGSRRRIDQRSATAGDRVSLDTTPALTTSAKSRRLRERNGRHEASTVGDDFEFSIARHHCGTQNRPPMADMPRCPPRSKLNSQHRLHAARKQRLGAVDWRKPPRTSSCRDAVALPRARMNSTETSKKTLFGGLQAPE